jgi:hypothetical protein
MVCYRLQLKAYFADVTLQIPCVVVVNSLLLGVGIFGLSHGAGPKFGDEIAPTRSFSKNFPVISLLAGNLELRRVIG